MRIMFTDVEHCWKARSFAHYSLYSLREVKGYMAHTLKDEGAGKRPLVR